MAQQEITLTIQLGNSDDKLSQREWNAFTNNVLNYISATEGCTVHFAGGPPSNYPWQNYCIVAVAPVAKINEIGYFISKMAERYRQESIAVTSGETELIKPVPDKEHYGAHLH